METKCPMCQRPLKIVAAGRHRCPNCRTAPGFDDAGRVFLV